MEFIFFGLVCLLVGSILGTGILSLVMLGGLARFLLAKARFQGDLKVYHPETLELIRGRGFGDFIGLALELERLVNDEDEVLSPELKEPRERYRLACLLFRWYLKPFLAFVLTALGSGAVLWILAARAFYP